MRRVLLFFLFFFKSFDSLPSPPYPWVSREQQQTAALALPVTIVDMIREEENPGGSAARERIRLRNLPEDALRGATSCPK